MVITFLTTVLILVLHLITMEIQKLENVFYIVLKGHMQILIIIGNVSRHVLQMLIHFHKIKQTNAFQTA